MADVEAGERKILVAIDQGEESMYALSWCLKNLVAENSKDTLVLCYAKPPRVMYSSLDGTGRNEHRQESGLLFSVAPREEYQAGYLFSADIMVSMDKYNTQVADCVIEKAKRLCKDFKDVKVESKVEAGDARDVICQMAEKLGVDVVVVGSHGYGLIQRTFLGSVSNHCAQNVKCPVLIVKRPKSANGDK